jgi:glycosyltransferase involved in cell wall biosynthesis
MRLLTIFPSTIRGGTEEYVFRIATAARHAGWEVHGAWPEAPGLRTFLREWQHQRMIYHRLAISVANDSPKTLTPLHHATRCARTLALLWKVRPKVVLLTLPWPTVGFGAIVACAIYGVPTMVSFQLIPWPAEIVGKTLKVYRRAHDRRQTWVVNSKDGQKNLCSTFKLAPEAVHIIRNGIKSNLFGKHVSQAERDKTRHELRTELGLAPATRLLVTVARLHVQKGYSDLLTAAKELIPEFPDIRFVWVGDGDLREQLEQQISSAGLDGRIILTGYRSDLSRFYQSADLFVFPTHFEGGASFALVEAMASGAPIVSSDASGIPEIVDNGIHGLLYAAKDPRALGETIRYALNHTAEMGAMAQRGRDRVAELTEERMCEDTLAELRRLGLRRVR